MSRNGIVGWWEEYKCGCVSETVSRKRDLLGYCKYHGDSRRHIHPEFVKGYFDTKKQADKP